MWIGVTLLVSTLILFPIYYVAREGYLFYISNFVAIFIFLSLTRYIFMLKHTPFARVKWFKFLWIFLPIPLLMLSIDNMMEFQQYLEEEGTYALIKANNGDIKFSVIQWIRSQYIFFGVGAIIVLLLIPVRMIISFWRTTNTVDRV